MSLTALKKEMKSLSNKKHAEASQWFFKTGKGDYGEGDQFLGLKVPVQRKIAAKYRELPLADAFELLKSKIHEHRLTALFIIIQHYKRADTTTKKKIYLQYLKNAKRVNNWDLVDSSAHYIVGDYLLNKPRSVLYKLARSKNLWEKRIAIIATFAFIDKKDYTDALKIATILKDDTHDLIHKAVGWVIREVGNKDLRAEEQWLKKYYKKLPRTMLRYAIEKFPEAKRKKYLAGTI